MIFPQKQTVVGMSLVGAICLANLGELLVMIRQESKDQDEGILKDLVAKPSPRYILDNIRHNTLKNVVPGMLRIPGRGILDCLQ